MPWTERTVACPECKTERTTRAGTGTRLGCSSCGLKFPAPPPVAEAPGAPAKPAVKRAKATKSVARQNARPRPKKTAPPSAGPDRKPSPEPAPPKPAPAAAAADGLTDPPAAPAPQDPIPEGGTPEPETEGRRRQRAAGRRGGLAYYARHLRKAS
jgi:ribosomal protein L37AE/L43A